MAPDRKQPFTENATHKRGFAAISVFALTRRLTAGLTANAFGLTANPFSAPSSDAFLATHRQRPHCEAVTILWVCSRPQLAIRTSYHHFTLPPVEPCISSTSERGTNTSPLRFSQDLQGFRSNYGSHYPSAFDTVGIAHAAGTSSTSHVSKSRKSNPAE